MKVTIFSQLLLIVCLNVTFVALSSAAQTDQDGPCKFPAITSWQFNLSGMSNTVGGLKVDSLNSYFSDSQNKFVQENCHGALKDESTFNDYTKRYKQACISVCATIPPANLLVGNTTNDEEVPATPSQIAAFKSQCHDSCVASDSTIYAYGLGLLRGAASCATTSTTPVQGNRGFR